MFFYLILKFHLDHTNKNLIGTSPSSVAVDSFDFVGTNRIQSSIEDGQLTIAKTNGLQTALDSKQNNIADDDLTIAKTSGLQTALDGKNPLLSKLKYLRLPSNVTTYPLLKAYLS